MPLSLPGLSRRSFLQSTLAATAALALPKTLSAAPLSATQLRALSKPAPSPDPDHIAFLSDVHVSGGINFSMSNHLSDAINGILSLPKTPNHVFIAGDCAHLTGMADDYREYVRRIQPLLDANLPLQMILGNHDNRDHFWNALPREQPKARAAFHRQSMVVEATHANWFLLDTLNQDDRESGLLGNDQLDWLAAELDARKQKPALILLHHDPVRDAKTPSLIDAEKLMAITRPRRHVKALFFGHTHIWRTWQDPSGLHMVNLPATGFTLWMKSFLGWVDARVYADAAFLTVHTLSPNRTENNQLTRLNWRT